MKNLIISFTRNHSPCRFFIFLVRKTRNQGNAFLELFLVFQSCESVPLRKFTLARDDSSAVVFSQTVQLGGRLYLAEWIIWPPAQFFNFYFLPTR